jgi:hypothetical protein
MPALCRLSRRTLAPVAVVRVQLAEQVVAVAHSFEPHTFRIDTGGERLDDGCRRRVEERGIG